MWEVWALTLVQIVYLMALLLAAAWAVGRLFACKHAEVITEIRRDEQGRILRPVILDYRCLHCQTLIGSTDPSEVQADAT